MATFSEGEVSRPIDWAAAADRAVGMALASMPEADREILTLVAWEGLSPAEVATVLGCSGAAARVRLYRARQRFARALEAGEARSGAAVDPKPAAKEGV